MLLKARSKMIVESSSDLYDLFTILGFRFTHLANGVIRSVDRSRDEKTSSRDYRGTLRDEVLVE